MWPLSSRGPLKKELMNYNRYYTSNHTCNHLLTEIPNSRSYYQNCLIKDSHFFIVIYINIYLRVNLEIFPCRMAPNFFVFSIYINISAQTQPITLAFLPRISQMATWKITTIYKIQLYDCFPHIPQKIHAEQKRIS